METASGPREGAHAANTGVFLNEVFGELYMLKEGHAVTKQVCLLNSDQYRDIRPVWQEAGIRS